jgi:hypothetical protein
VLILDDDLGRLLPACLALGRAGFDAVPSHTVREAESLLEALRVNVDVLVANPRLRAARSFVRRMRERNPALRVIELVGAGSGGPRDALVCCLDPSIVPDMEAGDWRALVRGKRTSGAGFRNGFAPRA